MPNPLDLQRRNVLKDTQLENLVTHISHITHSLVQQVDTEGIIRTFTAEKETSPDLPASHHLIDLLSNIDTTLFLPIQKTILDWMFNPKHGVAEAPFCIDSFSSLAEISENNTKLFTSAIAEHQLPNGAFDKFCAYVRGGDYFSTLWCAKILLKYSETIFEDQIDRAINYLIENKNIAEMQLNHLGYLALILIMTKNKNFVHERDSIIKDVFAKSKETSLEVKDKFTLADTFFVLEDLLEWSQIDNNSEVYDFVEQKLIEIFELDTEPKSIPKAISAAQEKCVESLYYQTLSRACIVGNKVCRINGYKNIGSDVHQLIFDDYRITRYTAIETHKHLKMFLDKYGGIHEQFVKYDDVLEDAWNQSSFNKTIFLIMPFKSTSNFRILTSSIKKVCEEKGFKAIRVDDIDRRFRPILWDNLVVNLLSAKYAIAVYVNDQIIDRITDENKLFANPNVALEFGWFQSRGQDVLILKDKRSIIPTDLQGFLWEEFDIENADKTAPVALEKWFAKIEKSNASNKANSADAKSRAAD